MSNIEVAKTIMQQLEQSFDMTVNGRKVSIFAYIGAKNFVYSDNSLMFEVSNRQKIVIELNGKDLYDTTLYSLKSFSVLKTSKDFYCDELKDVIFRMLGVD